MTKTWVYKFALEVAAGDRDVADHMTFGGIKKVIESLDSHSRKIIALRFKDNLTFFNMGVRLGISAKEAQNEYNHVIITIQTNNDMMNMLSSISVEEHNNIITSVRNMCKQIEPTSIEEAGFNSHTTNALMKAGINNIKNLTALNSVQVLNINGIGERSLLHIINVLDNHGLTLRNYENE